MSAKGNCYDNALADRFFYRFNAELVKVSLFKDLEQVKFGVFSYIEGYYKRVWLHFGLDYKTSLEFELELKIKKQSNKDSLVSIFLAYLIVAAFISF